MKNKLLSIHNFKRILLLISVFIISMNLASLYSGGDNNGYTAIYDAIKNKSIIDSFYIYNYVITTAEFVHFIIVWVVSNLGFDRVLFLSLVNTLLAGLIIKYFDILKVNFLITASFILTNYYLYVIFFTAERLKFGFIFFLFFLIAYHKEKNFSPIFLFLSVFSHLQMLIMCLGKAFEIFLKEIKPFIIQLQLKKQFILFFPIIILGFILTSSTQISGLPYILYKVFAYGGDRDIFDFLRMIIFFVISLYYSTNQKQTLTFFFPLFVAIFLFGGDRVNMLGYIFSLYYILPYRAGFNFGVLITSIYFLYQNLNFVNNIFLYGNGFPPS